MSAAPAQVRYNHEMRSYVAQFIGNCKPVLEMIPKRQEHRLRAFPQNIKSRMRPAISGLEDDDHTNKPNEHSLPYCVLVGTCGLSIGCSVELQWKTWRRSPFIWWYGVLENLRHQDGATAVATILFPHFPETSRFYRQHVQIGDGVVRPGAFGGFTGGIRRLSQTEVNMCLQFLPQAIGLISDLHV